MNLGTPGATVAVLEKYHLNIQKRFGQNFLIDGNVLQKITEGAGITKEDTVLEIGPGIGALTQYLSEASRRVIAVEIDKALIPVLSDTLSACDNVTVINNDILKVDLTALSEEYNEGRPLKVVANLPYYITTPILMELLENGPKIESITVMIQKEVADRLAASPGTKDYGALTLAVQYYADLKTVAQVSPECFIPRPQVGSTVIRLDRHGTPPVDVSDPALMFRLIRASFNQRRKTLANAVGNDGTLPFTREQTAEALRKMGFDERIRGERLSLADFARLTEILS